jgi:hypothetical protein
MSKKLKMYTIYDKKAGVCWQPFFVEHEIQAKRQFARLVSDDDSHVKTYPEDFRMLKLGEFDQETGEVTGEIEIDLEATDIARYMNQEVK